MCSIGLSFVKQNHHYDLRAENREKKRISPYIYAFISTGLNTFCSFFLLNLFRTHLNSVFYISTMNNFVPGDASPVEALGE